MGDTRTRRQPPAPRRAAWKASDIATFMYHALPCHDVTTQPENAANGRDSDWTRNQRSADPQSDRRCFHGILSAIRASLIPDAIGELTRTAVSGGPGEQQCVLQFCYPMFSAWPESGQARVLVGDLSVDTAGRTHAGRSGQNGQRTQGAAMSGKGASPRTKPRTRQSPCEIDPIRWTV
jgi:hypothetical protein